MYFKKNNDGEMLKLSYTVPSTGEVKNVTK